MSANDLHKVSMAIVEMETPISELDGLVGTMSMAARDIEDKFAQHAMITLANVMLERVKTIKAQWHEAYEASLPEEGSPEHPPKGKIVSLLQPDKSA